MALKIALYLSILLLALATAAQARHVYHNFDDSSSVSAGRRPHPASSLRSVPQGRVFPGALAIKKLVLLKFKKIVPISLILLKSSNDNEAELVPVYPTSEIPSNVQFIPTPNGISGHKDVQAIAIPSEFHQQLELHGLANLENIEALLNQAEPDASTGDSTVTIVEPMANADDQPLNIKEDDEDQLLEGVSIAEQPVKSSSGGSPSSTANLNGAGLRRIAADDLAHSGLKTSGHTTIEEIPLFLYSTKDSSMQSVHSSKRPGGRFIAIRRQH